jgi:hypothetical protein
VLRHRREADGERLRELGDRRLATGEPGQDGATGGVGERREGGAEVVGALAIGGEDDGGGVELWNDGLCSLGW